MPIDWGNYGSFDWANAHQNPMDGEQRTVVEAMVVSILGLSQKDRQMVWGAASPPGRFAATVFHVYSWVRHSFYQQATARGITEIGVKVFKTNGDARREAQRILPFHCKYIHHLPGLPNDHVQKTLDAGKLQDAQGLERDYIIQEWIPGETLEDLRRRWPQEPIDGVRVQSILEQLFAEIIIPLWGEGTIWWDVRDANYCWDEASGRLTLIDVDSLGAYIDEILQTPEVWERREKGQETALARLRQMALRLLLAQGLGAKSKAKAEFDDAWHAELEPALRALGRDYVRKQELKANALVALRRFLESLESANLT